MATVYERPPQQGQAQTHALVIGVGAYPNLAPDAQVRARFTMGLRPIQSPPFSARAFGDLILRCGACAGTSLGSVEFCTSPVLTLNDVPSSPADLESIREAFGRWHARCDENPENVAVLYFCGH